MHGPRGSAFLSATRKHARRAGRGCVEVIVDWWSVTTAQDFLECDMSRRKLWPWMVPAMVAFGFCCDVPALIFSPGLATATNVFWDSVGLLICRPVSRWPSTSFRLDLLSLVFMLGSSNFTLLQPAPGTFAAANRFAWPMVFMFVTQVFGLHGLVPISLFSAYCFVAFVMPSIFPLGQMAPEFVFFMFLATFSCLVIEYTVASSFRRQQQYIAEKHLLLDLATDGWGSLNSSTHVLTTVSDKLACTLGRKDLVGVPIEAVTDPRDHEVLTALLESIVAFKSSRATKTDCPRHALLTFSSAGLQFDARLIVHEATSETTDVNFCLTLVGELRKPDSAAAAEVLLTPWSSKGLPAEVAPQQRSASQINVSNNAELESVHSAASARRPAESEVSDESMWTVVEVGQPPLLKKAGPHRTVGVQTPSRFMRKEIDASQLAMQYDRLRSWQRPMGKCKRDLEARRQAVARLPAFECTPVTTRWRILRRAVSSFNTGLQTFCCPAHASWASVIEVIERHMDLPCTSLDLQYTDWQCGSCLAMNAWENGSPPKDTAMWQQCRICLKLVLPRLLQEKEHCGSNSQQVPGAKLSL
mmetsp:Transcript_51343/g.121971  ORF Transcript_51343/g.121971 Transcript_51343/m.121971 type:complete len:585 (-) Transcript_51343:105-1859(-)